jgi:hypothetical protein
MKRAGLPRIKSAFLCSALLISSFAITGSPHATAAIAGSGVCAQTVDNAADVAVASSAGYCYVAFKAGIRVWTVPTNVSVIDYLVVAGGGSGGARHGGGGGAGGLLKSTNVSLSNITTLNVSVGNGGGAVIPSGGSISAAGLAGSNSTLIKNSGTGSFTSVTAIGGGGGEAGGLGAQSGGSGGGAQYTTGGAATAGQGNVGGRGGSGTINSATNWWAGGGGGAGSPGGDGSSSGYGGAGGTGAIWVSAFTPTIATSLGLSQTGQVSGDQVYFAGGGGGAITLSYTPGSGGTGGGGDAVTGNNIGESGTPNSGGGGGGTGCCDGGLTGAGGSGVVLIRYLLPSFTNAATATIAERTSTTTNAATINVTESSTVTLRPVLDSSFFTVVFVDSVTARIRFSSTPDFEARADSGGNNEYDLTIRATLLSGNYSESSLKITVTDVIETAVLGAPSLSGSPSKGRSVTITATSDTPGTMRFFFAGKKIPNCLARATIGSYPNYSATCSWKPAVTGSQQIYSTLTPTDGALSVKTSPAAFVFVLNRTTLR